MSHRLERVARFALERRWVAFTAWGLLVLVALPGLLRLRIDNEPALFFPEEAAPRRAWEELGARFGPASALRVVVEGGRLFSAGGPESVLRLADELAATAGVVAVDRPRAFRVDGGAGQPPAPQALREQLAASRLDRALGFTSADGSAISLAVTLAPAGPVERRARLAAIERAVDGLPAGLGAAVVGLPTLDRALDDASRDVFRRLLPLLVATSLLLLLVTFRDAVAVAAPILFVAAVGTVLFGAMGWLGVTFDLVLAVLPPVLFSIGLAVAVHLLIRCRDLGGAGGSERDAIAATFAEKGPALFWTTISTAVGFGALAATPIAPIRTLGVWGALAMFLVGAGAVTLYPGLLLHFPGRARRRLRATSEPPGRRAAPVEHRLERALSAFGGRIAASSARHRFAVLALFAATTVVAGFGMARMRVESNALSYLAGDDPVRIAFARAEALGMGLATVELVGEAPAGRTFAEGDELSRLARLAERCRELPGTISAVSAVDLLDEVARSSPLARAFSNEELRPRLLPLVAADREGQAALRRFLTDDRRTTRLTLFVETAGYERIDPIVASALAAARELFPGASFHATGQLPLLLETQRRLLATLTVSLAGALPLLALVFAILLRSVPRALLALVPNVWPVATILGAMGWLGVPVDIATVMVASIVLGLVVDDTIHTLEPFRALAARVGARRAVAERLEKTAPAFLLSGVVLASGFAVCTLSEFEPAARFGALSVAAIAIALVADLLLVPALFGSD